MWIVFSRTNIYDLDETMRFLKIVADNDLPAHSQLSKEYKTYHKVQRQKLARSGREIGVS